MTNKTQNDILTYEQMFKKLKDNLVSKAQIHFELENQINQNKLTHSILMEEYLRTEEEWYKASKNYSGFLAKIIDKDINPNDMVSLN